MIHLISASLLYPACIIYCACIKLPYLPGMWPDEDIEVIEEHFGLNILNYFAVYQDRNNQIWDFFKLMISFINIWLMTDRLKVHELLDYSCFCWTAVKKMTVSEIIGQSSLMKTGCSVLLVSFWTKHKTRKQWPFFVTISCVSC